MRKANKEDLQRELWLRERPNVYWKTKMGELIPLTDMTTEHIRNTIRMLERQEEMEELFLDALGDMPNKFF